jgi:hypothetical protein
METMMVDGLGDDMALGTGVRLAQDTGILTLGY